MNHLDLNFFFKPNLNEFEYDYLDNILVFLNTHTKKKNPITNQFDLKYGGKNSKPNNKSINLFILDLKKIIYIDFNKFEIN